MKNDFKTSDEAAEVQVSDVKSKILRRISEELEKSKQTGKDGDFRIVTGTGAAGEGPVMATYYKGGSYVKISLGS